MAGEKCGAHRKHGKGLCGLAAGHDTDHPGTGRCKYHGGSSLRGIDHPKYKFGLTSKVTKQAIADMANEFLQNPQDLFKMEHEIANMRALVVHTLNVGAVEEGLAAIEKLSKVIKIYSEMERGSKTVIDIRIVKAAILQVVGVVRTHVKDDGTLERIARDLARLNLIDSIAAAHVIEA